MSLDWISEPVAEGAECGPDLQIAADPQFMEYYFNAESRLPERYLLPSVFDPTSIRIRDEESRITALLRRSRDVRLLTLLARFQILAGKLRGFADAVAAIDRLLEAWPDAANPTMEGGRRARIEALETLASTPWVVMPLQYLPLNGNPEITLRRYQVASGEATARAGEEDLNAQMILDQLRSPAARAGVEALMRDLGRAEAALDSIADFSASRGRPLDFARPLSVIEDIGAMVALALPDLALVQVAAALPEAAEVAAADPLAAPVLRPPGIAETAPAGQLGSQGEARATLAAIETWLAANEPSSAALLLVTQARQLVGRPLVEALEALLPADAANAVIDLGAATGFRLNMDRLKALTGAGYDSNITGPGLTARPDPLPPRISTRAEVAAWMRAVEIWYRQNEPTSPIPLLLVRGRSWLDKDFESILAELLPNAKPS